MPIYMVDAGFAMDELFVEAPSAEEAAKEAVEQLKELILSGAIPLIVCSEQTYSEEEAARYGEDPPDDWEPETADIACDLGEEIRRLASFGNN